jgi:carbonic anhydrase/acetyltransferase-like protein (isoleucine patch superfamily)
VAHTKDMALLDTLGQFPYASFADCFLSMRSMIYSATIEDSVWIGMGAIIMQATLQSHVKVPEGAVIRGRLDLMGLLHVSHKEQTYMDEVHRANSRLRKDYLELRGKAQSLRDKARTQ